MCQPTVFMQSVWRGPGAPRRGRNPTPAASSSPGLLLLTAPTVARARAGQAFSLASCLALAARR